MSFESRFPVRKDPSRVARQGMQLAHSIGDEELYSQFDRIDDALQLASCGIYGTVEACRTELEQALERYMAPAPREVFAGVR